MLIAVSLLAGVLSGCTKAPAPEPPAAYFQGAIKKTPHYFSQDNYSRDNYSQDKPGEVDSAVGAVPESVGGAAVPAVAVASGPKFQVMAERFNDRPDDMSNFYVTIDPVDPSAESFKVAVKQVLVALAAANGGPTFSASIWDHRSAAQTEVSYRSNPDQFSEELITAKEAFNDQHLVANYVGGLSSVGEPPSFLLFWFPHAGATSPNVGQWVSAEVWKP